MAKINGIGGVFLKVNTDIKELLKWYQDILELDVTEYGVNFLQPNVLTLLTFDRSESDAILNFSVDNLDDYLAKLIAKDVVIHKEIEKFEYGKFVQIKDVAGNIIELWEPFTDNYVKMVQKEIDEYKSS